MEVKMALQTEELGLVAALAVGGIAPQRIVRRNGRAAFEYGPEADPIVRNHYAGKLLVSSLAFAEAMRTAKGQAMNALPEPVGVG